MGGAPGGSEGGEGGAGGVAGGVIPTNSRIACSWTSRLASKSDVNALFVDACSAEQLELHVGELSESARKG